MGALMPAVLSRLAKELKELTRQPCEGIRVGVESCCFSMDSTWRQAALQLYGTQQCTALQANHVRWA